MQHHELCQLFWSLYIIRTITAARLRWSQNPQGMSNKETCRRITDFKLGGGRRVGRSKTSVDGWCGERLEKAGDPMVVDSHQGQLWKGFLQQALACCSL